jgi:cytochrome c oxidase cbb3-type subunit I
MSCRLPSFVLFAGAAVWGVMASALALIASIKFHSPEFLAGCTWLTYGRAHAAAVNAQLYGFALPAGLGVALWIIARLGGNRVSQPGLIAVGALLWNAGVAVGILAILAGDRTGFEDLDMPRYAALILFVAYLLMGLWTMLTLHHRREARLRSPQWFLLVAVLWFPWIYSTANLLLLVCPVRGVNQSIISWWYSNNLTFVWLSLAGLGAVFYLVPRFAGRALHSDHLGSFGLWTLILFGSWAGVPNSAPVPAWMPSLSAVATVLMAIPLLAVAINLYRTLTPAFSHPGGEGGPAAVGPAEGDLTAGRFAGRLFLGFGIAAWLLAGAMKIAGALPAVSSVTQFTWFTVAQAQLNSQGFFAMIMLGAIYHITPPVAGMEWPCAKSVRAHFWLAAAGILLVVLPLAAGGIVQGIKLNHPEVAFMDVTKATLPFLRASTAGELFILAGQLLFLANLIRLAARFCRARFAPVYRSMTVELKPAEVKP